MPRCFSERRFSFPLLFRDFCPESAAAGGSCFPSQPRRRLHVLPVLRAGSSPAVAAGRSWAGGPRLRRRPAEGGLGSAPCPALPRERSRPDTLGRAPGAQGHPRAAPSSLGGLRAGSRCASSRRIPGCCMERAPGMELPRLGFGAGSLRLFPLFASVSRLF